MQDNVIKFVYDASSIPDTEFVPATNGFIPSAQLDLPQDDNLTTITNGPLSSVEVIPAAGEGKDKDDVTLSDEKEEVEVTDEPEDINLEIDEEKLNEELFDGKSLEQVTAEREKLQDKYEEVLNEEGNADEMAFLVKIIELYDNKIEELEEEQHRKEVLAAKDVIFKPTPKKSDEKLETAEEVSEEIETPDASPFADEALADQLGLDSAEAPVAQETPAPETQFLEATPQETLGSAEVVQANPEIGEAQFGQAAAAAPLASADAAPINQPTPDTRMQTPTSDELLGTIDVLPDEQATPEVAMEDEAQAGLLDSAENVPVDEETPEADNFAGNEEETVEVNLSNEEEILLADLVSEQIKKYGEDSIYRQEFLDKVKKELKAEDLEDDELLGLVAQVAEEVKETLQSAPDTQMSDDNIAPEMSTIEDILTEDTVPETQLGDEATTQELSTIDDIPTQDELPIVDEALSEEEAALPLESAEAVVEQPAVGDAQFRTEEDANALNTADEIPLENEAPVENVDMAAQKANRQLLDTIEEVSPEQEELVITDDDFTQAPEQAPLNTAETIVIHDDQPTEIKFVNEDGQVLDTVEVVADNPTPRDVEFEDEPEDELLGSADYVQLQDEQPVKEVSFQHSRPRIEMLGTAEEIPFVDDEPSEVEFEEERKYQPLSSAERVATEVRPQDVEFDEAQEDTPLNTADVINLIDNQPQEVEFHREVEGQPLDSADEYLTLEEDDTPEVEFAREQPQEILDSADRFLPEEEKEEPIVDDFNFADEEVSSDDLLSDYDIRRYEQQLDDLYFQRNRLYETLDSDPNDEETQELIAIVEQEILKIQAVLGLGDNLETPVTSDTLSVEERPRVHIVHKQEEQPTRDAYAEYQARAPARITSAEEVAESPKVEDVEFMPNAGGKLTDAWKATKGALETAAGWMKNSKTAKDTAKTISGAAKVAKVALPTAAVVTGTAYAGSNGGNLWRGVTDPTGYGNEKTAKAVYEASLNDDIDKQTLYNTIKKANKGFTGFLGDPFFQYDEDQVAKKISNDFDDLLSAWKTQWVNDNGSNPTTTQVNDAKKKILQKLSSDLTNGTTSNLSVADINASITPASTSSLLSGLAGSVNNSANQEVEAYKYLLNAYGATDTVKQDLLDAGYGRAEVDSMTPYELMIEHRAVDAANSKYLNRRAQAEKDMAKNLSLYEQYIVNGDANKKGNWDPENNPNDKVLQEAGFDGSGMTPAELLQARNSIKDNEAIKVAAQTQAATRNKQILDSAVNSLKNSLGAGLTDSSNNPSGRQATSLIRDALGTDLGASASQLITDINSADVQTRQTILKTVQEYTNRLAQLDQGRYAAALDDQTLLNSLGLRQDYIDTIRNQMRQMDAQERQEALTWLGVASQLMGNLSEEYSADAQDINTLMARYALSQLFSKTGIQLA